MTQSKERFLERGGREGDLDLCLPAARDEVTHALLLAVEGRATDPPRLAFDVVEVDCGVDGRELNFKSRLLVHLV